MSQKLLGTVFQGVIVKINVTETPWNTVPTQVSENVAVIKVTDYGCVGESSMGSSVVVPNCDADVGDIVSATFYIQEYVSGLAAIT